VTQFARIVVLVQMNKRDRRASDCLLPPRIHLYVSANKSVPVSQQAVLAGRRDMPSFEIVIVRNGESTPMCRM
jgi:hypothetical protein